MEKLSDVMQKVFPIEPLSEEVCGTCGNPYIIYDTPRGELGTCKHCLDQELYDSLHITTKAERKREKDMRFASSFERVSNDLTASTLTSYEPRHSTQVRAKYVATAYVERFTGYHSLLFSGGPGLGKSHLSYAIVKSLREKGFHTLYIKVTDLFDRLKQAYRPHAEQTEEQIFHMLEWLDVLVLDDLGSEYVRVNDSGHETWATDVLFKIFDSRLNKATICTTNYSEQMLVEKYGVHGERIIDRLLDMTTVTRLEGESYRRRREHVI